MHEAKYVTVPVAAKMLCLSETTMRALVENGEIPYKKIGNLRRIPLSYIDSLDVEVVNV